MSEENQSFKSNCHRLPSPTATHCCCGFKFPDGMKTFQISSTSGSVQISSQCHQSDNRYEALLWRCAGAGPNWETNIKNSSRKGSENIFKEISFREWPPAYLLRFPPTEDESSGSWMACRSSVAVESSAKQIKLGRERKYYKSSSKYDMSHPRMRFW